MGTDVIFATVIAKTLRTVDRKTFVVKKFSLTTFSDESYLNTRNILCHIRQPISILVAKESSDEI